MSTLPRVAVLLPCLNEAATIGAVVQDFARALPDAQIWVYDNGSTDATAEVARDAGARVAVEPRRGKGNVVRRMFADVDADVYVMVDGDGTYEAAAAPAMVTMLLEQHLDMVTGTRLEEVDADGAFRRGHRFGNSVFSGAVRAMFRSDCSDVLSGYRVLSRRFVKSFPSVGGGFEIEVEMTAHASLLRVPTGELQTRYVERDASSESKLRTYRDGVRIGLALFRLFRSFSPSRFFGTFAGLAAVVSLLFLTGVFADGLGASRAEMGVAFATLATLLLSVGIILNAAMRQRVEMLRLRYLEIGLP